VVYLRGSGYAEIAKNEGHLAAWILRCMVKHAAVTVVLGESLVGMARSVYRKARVAVVPNGCLPAVPLGSEGSRDESHPIVGYIGRLGPEKGIDEAVEAARLLAPDFPGLEFIMGGSWESADYERRVKELVERHGLANVMNFPGPVSLHPKADLLTRAWVLMVPSHTEGHPWVILEAMSAGLPVVATDTGAIAETVEDGVAGFVVPVSDSKALADRIALLLRDDALWKRMSHNALQRYEDHYTMQRSHGLLAEALCQVAEERRTK
jgi:glycosyltransferase involved in cell wall biosynthesis